MARRARALNRVMAAHLLPLDEATDRLRPYARRYVGGVPTSDEFLVNTSETEGDQKAPAVAAAPDGRFVVVWETDRPDPGGPDIVGQLYDASGSPIGTQFDVDTVTAGQGLIVVEAMKMQNELKAPKEGRVATLPAQEGATVAAGETLASIE